MDSPRSFPARCEFVSGSCGEDFTLGGKALQVKMNLYPRSEMGR